MTKTSVPIVVVSSALVLASGLFLWRRRRRQDKTKKDDKISSEEGTLLDHADVLALIQNRRSIFPKQFATDDESDVPKAVLEDLLEAARWAPSHHLTESWHFIVFHTPKSRAELASFLADTYREECVASGKDFLQAKYDKKRKSASQSSFIIALCYRVSKKSREEEEMCSLACAVQNMHLMATAHRVGAYWSSAGIYRKVSSTDDGGTTTKMMENSGRLMELLKLPIDEYKCLGWFYVGPYPKSKLWPQGRRKPCNFEIR